MTNQPTVKIIKVGTLCHEASEFTSNFSMQLKSELGIGGGSTVTLIDSGLKILVDTGYDNEWMNNADNDRRNISLLKRALKDYGLIPDDVDIVFITHWHRDHFGNLGIFKKARLMASKPLIDRFGLMGFTGVDDGEEIANGVKVMLTPGHTAGHASLLVDTIFNKLKARIAVAGDAVVSYSYFLSGSVWRYNADFYDADVVKESVNKLIRSCDILIPGHGAPFMTYQTGSLPGYSASAPDSKNSETMQ